MSDSPRDSQLPDTRTQAGEPRDGSGAGLTDGPPRAMTDLGDDAPQSVTVRAAGSGDTAVGGADALPRTEVWQPAGSSGPANATAGGDPSIEPLPEIPDYDVLNVLGRGGMGVVLRARHRVLGRLAAIKLPLGDRALRAEERERFLREARAAARLRHPHICAVHEIGESQGRPFLAMDFIEGQTLQEWSRAGGITARRAAEIVALLARAVGYAHDHGVVHRDLKPGNVMLDSVSGQPVLMDFGLAKQLADADDSELTHTGQVMGTPVYMAPEQAAGRGDDVGPHSDVYSLGAILYELLSGQPPFAGPVGEVLRRVQTEEPPPPRKLNPRLHRDLETICLTAMAKEAARRYASAVALGEDLNRFIAGEAVLARRESRPAAAMRWIRRRPALAATALVAVAALALGGWAAVRGAERMHIAQLQGRLEAGLDATDWDAEHVLWLDALAADLATVRPAEATSARERITAALVEDVERRVRSPRVDESTFARVEAGLAVLRARDATAADRLADELARRRRSWHVVASLPDDGQFASQLGEQVQTDGDTLRVNETSGGEPLWLAVHSGSQCQLEAEFAAGWERATQLGLVLNGQRGATDGLRAIAASPDGARIATGGDDRVRVWDAASGEVLWLSKSLPGAVTDLVYTRDALLAAAGNLHAWSADAHEPLALPAEIPGGVSHLVWTAAGNQIVLADATGLLSAWSWPGAERVWSVQAAQSVLSALAINRNGRRLCVAAAGQAWWCEMEGEPALRALTVIPENINALAISDDGRWVAASAGGKELRIWDTSSGHLADSPTAVADSLVFAPGEQRLLTGDGGGIHAWTPGAKQLVRWQPLQSTVVRMAFAPGGGTMLAADEEQRVQRWSWPSGESAPPLYDTRYGIRIRALRRTAGEPSSNATSVAFADARDEGEIVLQILRDGSVLQEQRIDPERLPAGPLNLRATRQGAKLTAQVNALPPLTFDDAFPIALARGGTFGVELPTGIGLKRLVASRRSDGAAASPLERGDEFYDRGQFQAAVEQYRRQAVEAPDAVGQEARYKEGMCLLAMAAEDEACEAFQHVAVEQGERWPLLAMCQLWVIAAEAERWQDADELLESLAARYSMEQFVGQLPRRLRLQLVQAYITRTGGFGHFWPDAERIARQERFAAVTRLTGESTANTWSRWTLLRSYHAAGRLDEARELSEQLYGEMSAEDRSLPRNWLEEHAWLLRLNEQPELALERIERFLFERPGVYRAADKELLLERARALAALGRWQEAERSLLDLLESSTFAAADPLSHRHASICLTLGFVREAQGDAEGAVAAWRLAARDNLPEPTFGLTRLVDRLIVLSLAEELTDPRLQTLVEHALSVLSATTASDEAAPQDGFAGVSGLILPELMSIAPGVLRRMWRTEQGHAIARKIALGELSLPELMRESAVLAAHETARQKAFPDVMTVEQEIVAWQIAADAYDAFHAGQFSTPQLLALALAWKGQTNFLGWRGLATSLSPELRGGLAYLLGQRYRHHRNEPEQARRFFEEAVQFTANPELRRLAELELEPWSSGGN